MAITAGDEQAARSAFAEWASLQAGAPRFAGELIQNVDVRYEHVGILVTDILGRRVAWKSIPAGSRSRVSFPSVTPEDVDPWTADSSSLRERSDHVAICEACGGEKNVRCRICGGTGKLLCTACDGQRKMSGYAANGARRLLNCTTCRGKGEVDCSNCRRGIANCQACGGEGRLQRWIELEWWRRSVTSVHHEALARRFGWNGDISNEAIARDAELVYEADEPHRLSQSDLGDVSAQWLQILNPSLQAGERVARQRLRIARAPLHTIHYRLGSTEERVVFTGRRLFTPPADLLGAFGRRAANLRSLAWLLICVGLAAALLSLGRGVFYASAATFLSLVAVTGVLLMTYRAVADWTAARRHTKKWSIAAALCLAIAVACAFAARPRLEHAQQLIAAGTLDAAERELHALGADASSAAWADLRLARIRGSSDVAAARALLQQIPRNLPQYSVAAPLVYLPLVERDIARRDWSAAARGIVEARGVGIDPASLAPFAAAIREAADDAVAEAKRERDAARRLRLRLAAESTLVAWERSTDNWGTPALISLRTAMARDVAALEKPTRRRRR